MLQGEFSVANVALVGLLPSVSPHVPPQVLGRPELPRAEETYDSAIGVVGELASELLERGVQLVVVVDGRGHGGEVVAAALEGPFGHEGLEVCGMSGSEVLHGVFFRAVAVVAKVAFEGVRVDDRVHFPHVLVVAAGIALVAFVKMAASLEHFVWIYVVVVAMFAHQVPVTVGLGGEPEGAFRTFKGLLSCVSQNVSFH